VINSLFKNWFAHAYIAKKSSGMKTKKEVCGRHLHSVLVRISGLPHLWRVFMEIL